jgi:hypothetical protein
MRSGPRARGASCPDLIISNRHLKLDLGPTIHAASCQQKTLERFSVSPEGFSATDKLIRRLASASSANRKDPTRRDRSRREEMRRAVVFRRQPRMKWYRPDHV